MLLDVSMCCRHGYNSRRKPESDRDFFGALVRLSDHLVLDEWFANYGKM